MGHTYNSDANDQALAEIAKQLAVSNKLTILRELYLRGGRIAANEYCDELKKMLEK